MKAFTWEGPIACLTIIPQFNNSEVGRERRKGDGVVQTDTCQEGAAILSWGRAGQFSEARVHPSKSGSKRRKEKLRRDALT